MRFLSITAEKLAKVEVKDPLDIISSPWSAMKVYYCVGDGPKKVEMRSWSTSDPAVLSQLHTKLMIYDSTFSPVGAMRTNRIEITRVDGGRLVMYIFHADFIGIYNPDNRQQKYSMFAPPCFLKSLGEEIRRRTGDEAHFIYDQEVDIVKDKATDAPENPVPAPGKPGEASGSE